jgi:hypothetical protein
VRIDRLWQAGMMKPITKTVAFVLVVYFGLLLIPEWWPALRATPTYFVYVLTLPLAVLVLIALACWGAFGLHVARRRHSARQATCRSMLTLSIIGLLFFASAYGLVSAIRRGLPSGSHLLRFDSARRKDGADIVPVCRASRRNAPGPALHGTKDKSLVQAKRSRSSIC